MFVMKDGKVGPAHLKIASSPSYTLAELRSSMEEFLNDMKTRGHVTTYGADSLTDWKFETYLQWLAKREQGKEGNAITEANT